VLDRRLPLDEALPPKEVKIPAQGSDVELAVGIRAARRDRAQKRGIFYFRLLLEDTDDVIGVRTRDLAVRERIVVVARTFQKTAHELEREIAMVGDESAAVHEDRGLLVGVDRV